MPWVGHSIMNWLQDKAMYALIGSNIIYNVSWEDPRIDCDLLELGPEDTILMLTSGGCNVLDMVIEGPKRVVAADLNPHQSALMELKKVCIQNIEYDQFFQLFAANNVKLFQELYKSTLRAKLSPFAQQFWDKNGNSFFKNVMWSGASGWAAWLLVCMAYIFGLGGLIEGVRNCATMEEQRAVYAKYQGRINFLANIVHATRRIWCPLIAVPASQLNLSQENIVKKAADNLFLNTHISRDNYHYYGYFYGKYTTECCPRYLRKEHWATLKANIGNLDIQTGTLQDVAGRYTDGFFTRYILLDHMDWMPMSMVLDEWAVFQRKARKGNGGCRILWRSYSDTQHIAPLKYLTFLTPRVEAALKKWPDRVAMYNSTHLATFNDSCAMVPREAYAPRASCGDDLRVLFHNWLHPIKGADHKGRLESFYAGQARSYDVFRHRFLHGRVPMIEAMPVPLKGGVWVDLGGGTAANLEHLKSHIGAHFSRVVVLDLCKPLLDVAAKRIEANKEFGWDKVVSTVEGDACSPTVAGLPAEGTVDLVTMSYSLTMIPDWRAALLNALRLLKPGGHIAISDFTVRPEHSSFTRWLWPTVFKTDGVRPSAEHIDTLDTMFTRVHLEVSKGGFPYVPFLKAPFYFYVGQKPGGAAKGPAGGAASGGSAMSPVAAAMAKR